MPRVGSIDIPITVGGAHETITVHDVGSMADAYIPMITKIDAQILHSGHPVLSVLGASPS